MEEFLNELEHDKIIRKNVALFRNDDNIKKLSEKELKRISDLSKPSKNQIKKKPEDEDHKDEVDKIKI